MYRGSSAFWSRACCTPAWLSTIPACSSSGSNQARALAGDSPQFDRGLEVRLANIFEAPPMAERIAHLLGPAYTVGDWTQTNIGLFSGLKLETFTHFLVLLLIVLVAAFNIVATLVMVVMGGARRSRFCKPWARPPIRWPPSFFLKARCWVWWALSQGWVRGSSPHI